MTELPNNVKLNLDELDYESVDAEAAKRAPFTFQLGGREITMIDPSTLDWRDLMEIENPVYFLKYALSEEVPEGQTVSDKEHVKAQAMPGWKLGKLIEGYIKHYGLDKQGNGVASRI